MQKMPDLKIFLSILLFIFAIAAFAQYSSEHYYIDLMKHYISLNEYQLALDVAESEHFVDCPDSLFWFKGYIHKVQKEPQKALSSFIKVIEISDNDALQKKAYEEVIRYLDILSTQERIELFVTILEYVDKNLYKEVILKLARIYEQNNLYNEANDIYINLLENNIQRDTLGLRIKIATNDILQRNYADAVTMARNIQANGDSTQIPQALFLEFMGHYSQDDFDPALEAIVKLYLDYPEFSQKFEIYLSLAELFIIKGHHLAAWFVIDEYYPEADFLEKQIFDDLKDIALEAIKKPENQVDIFDLFKQDFRKLLP